MTSFGWKRKAGSSISKAKAKAFEEDSKDEDLSEIENGNIDWLHLAPARKMVFSLEDAESKSLRLQKEGGVLAEAERYWEALKKWESAVQLTPDKAVLHELRAQAYLELNEPLPALSSARKAVECEPTWYIGYVTMGRAQLNIGEVNLAIRSFSRAVFLNPFDTEIWTEDLAWAIDLRNKHRAALETEAEEKEKAGPSCKVTELPEGAEGNEVTKWKVDPNSLLPMPDETESRVSQERVIKSMPKNMVKLRF